MILVDYAILGYDIITGFPESNSHDPGFTHRIFVADYAKDSRTADCRYSLPKGYVVIPDGAAYVWRPYICMYGHGQICVTQPLRHKI